MKPKNIMKTPICLVVILLVLIANSVTGRTVNQRSERALDPSDPLVGDDDDTKETVNMASKENNNNDKEESNVGKEEIDDELKKSSKSDDDDVDDSKTEKPKDDEPINLSNTSEDEDNKDSKSNPETEEEGDSISESDEDEKPVHADDEDKQVVADEDLSASDSDESASKSDESGDKSSPKVNSKENKGSEGSKNDDSDEKKNDPNGSGNNASSEEDRNNKLIVILLDGLKSGAIESDLKKLKAFNMIKSNGVSAQSVIPVFPSQSYPNYASILTGLYPNKHQIWSNDMYSIRWKETWNINSDAYSHTHWWNRAEPLWTRAKRAGKRVGAYWWPGCEIEILKTSLDKCVMYKDLTESKTLDSMVEEKFDEILKDFAADNLDIAFVYYELIDHIGHHSGYNSKSYKKSIRRADALIGELLEDINEKNMNNSVNVYILSDHGHTIAEKSISVDNYMDFNNVDNAIIAYSLGQIWPEAGKTKFVLDTLKNANVDGLNVYNTSKLPNHWHLHGTHHLPPILLTTDPGYYLKKSDQEHAPEGVHGADPMFDANLNAIMFAIGPDFRKGYQINKMNMVDHYNILCSLLDIRPRDNDGDSKLVQKVLSQKENNQDESSSSSSSEEDDGDDTKLDEENDEREPEYLSSHGTSSQAQVSLFLLIVTVVLNLINY